jgi:hypothetical protein
MSMSIKTFIRSMLIISLTLLLTGAAVSASPVRARQDPLVFLPLVPRQEKITINFDDLSAPTDFMDTVALRDEYASLGVHFSGKAGNDGGGILNENGDWGVTGFSAPNILVFDSAATGPNGYPDGGTPNTPEWIWFDWNAGYISAKFGSGNGFSAGETVTLTAYDVDSNELAFKGIVLGPTMQTLSVSSPDINYVIITSAAQYLVMDDLVIVR